jgi:hypothetical protein
MVCPCCGLLNPPEARRCDCGYDFEDRQVRDSYVSSNERAFTRGKQLRLWLPPAILAGIFLAFFAAVFTYEPVIFVGALVLAGALFPYIWKSA